MEDITENTFETEVLQEKKLVVIDFYTSWCQPCKKLTPLIEELSKEMSSVKFVKINAEENSKLAANYDVRTVPTLVLIKGGTVVESIIGLQSKEELQKKIDGHV